MKILFLFTVTALTVPLSLSLLYSFYKYKRFPKGQVLLTIKPINSGKPIYGIVLSIFFAAIAISLFFVGVGEELKGGHRIDPVGWMVIVEVSILLGILSVVVFQRRGKKVLQFTDKGIILGFEVFEWDKIDECKWETPVKFLGMIINFKENPSGDILFIQCGWRWRRSYHFFDASTKQQANEILKSRGKMLI